MIELYRDTLDSEIPRLVANVLRTDELCGKYFNGLADHDFEEFKHWRPRAPYLAVVPGDLGEPGRGLSSQVHGTYLVNVLLYLPPIPPRVDRDIAFTQVPTATVAAGAGALTGAYRWAMTGYTATGESFVPETDGEVLVTSELTLTAQNATLAFAALPAGLVGRCIWRTRAGGLRFQLEAIVPGAATSYTSSRTDAQLLDVSAPIRHETRRLRSYIKRRLVLDQDLKVAGRARARNLLFFRDRDDSFLPTANVRIVTIGAEFQIQFNAQERR